MAATLLVGSAALAQQGLIVEPWRSAPRGTESSVRVAPVASVPRRQMPASGLPPLEVAPLAKAREASAPPAPLPWKPPVVALLVDPWAKPKPRLSTTAVELTRGPLAADIVDPWASRPRSVEAPTPRRQTIAPHSTIF